MYLSMPISMMCCMETVGPKLRIPMAARHKVGGTVTTFSTALSGTNIPVSRSAIARLPINMFVLDRNHFILSDRRFTYSKGHNNRDMNRLR